MEPFGIMTYALMPCPETTTMIGRDDWSKDPKRGSDENRHARCGAIDQNIQAEIGKQLRAAYDDVINEPIPPRLIELLEKLELSTRKN